jgi:hypothetical protein
MLTIRLWLFRLLVFAAAAIMLISAIMPWWKASIQILGHAESGIDYFEVLIYQHGIPDNFAREYFREDITPAYQVTLAWAYMGVSLGLIAISAFLKGNKGRWLLGITGAVYIVYAIVCIITMIARTGAHSVPLQGEITIEESIRQTSFQTGYYLAYTAGLACLLLAIFRNRIAGQIKSKA